MSTTKTVRGTGYDSYRAAFESGQVTRGNSLSVSARGSPKVAYFYTPIDKKTLMYGKSDSSAERVLGKDSTWIAQPRA